MNWSSVREHEEVDRAMDRRRFDDDDERDGVRVLSWRSGRMIQGTRGPLGSRMRIGPARGHIHISYIIYHIHTSYTYIIALFVCCTFKLLASRTVEINT